MEETENPTYYAIIPANVRYDKDLNANAKLLYGEIVALCTKNGYCWATNEYFGNLYNVSVRSITQWLSNLEKKDYIKIEQNSRQNVEENFHNGRKIVLGNIEENFLTPLEENFQYNNTSNNNTSNNKYKRENIKREKQMTYDSYFQFLNSQDKEQLTTKIDLWLQYKKERKQTYKETGLKSLLTTIEKYVVKYGVEEACKVIDKSITNNWQGLFFKELDKKGLQQKQVDDENEIIRTEVHDGLKIGITRKGKNVVLGIADETRVWGS